MKIIKLKGISGKGKNRIAQHGEKWRIIGEMDRLPCRPEWGEPTLIESKKTGNLRWISLTDDPDFVIL